MFSQPGWNWPDNKSLAEEKNVLYTDYLKQGDCLSSLEHHSWLLDNVPNLHVSIYQNGIKIYQCLITKEEEAIIIEKGRSAAGITLTNEHIHIKKKNELIFSPSKKAVLGRDCRPDPYARLTCLT